MVAWLLAGRYRLIAVAAGVNLGVVVITTASLGWHWTSLANVLVVVGLGALAAYMRHGRARPFDPDWTVGPGEVLAEWMEENAASYSARLDEPDVEAVLRGDPLTPEVADVIAEATGTPAGFWQALEAQYRADLVVGKIDELEVAGIVSRNGNAPRWGLTDRGRRRRRD